MLIVREMTHFDARLHGNSDFRGTTALHYAVLADRKEVVKILMEFGADPNVRNKIGHIPRDLARDDEMRSALDAYAEDVI